MAIATTHDFTMNRDEIVDQALTLIGVTGPNVAPTGDQRAHASKALNSIVKSRDADGTMIHRLVRKTLTTVASQAQYTLDGQCLDVDGPMTFIESGGTVRTVIHSYTGKDYMYVSDRTTEARAPQYYFIEWTEPQVMKATFWPIPSTSSDTIEYRAALESFDFDAGGDDPDFPAKWIRALYFATAADLAPAYGQTAQAQFLMDVAEAEFDKQMAANNERGDLVISPFGMRAY